MSLKDAVYGSEDDDEKVIEKKVKAEITQEDATDVIGNAPLIDSNNNSDADDFTSDEDSGGQANSKAGKRSAVSRKKGVNRTKVKKEKVKRERATIDTRSVMMWNNRPVNDRFRDLYTFNKVLGGLIAGPWASVVDVPSGSLAPFGDDMSFDTMLVDIADNQFFSAFTALKTFVQEVGSMDAKSLTSRELLSIPNVLTHSASWMAAHINTYRQLSGSMWARKENAHVIAGILERDTRFFRTYRRP
jgi:hypothetical protein